MKKIVLVVLISLTGFGVNAQTGSLLLAENFNYTAGNLGTQGSWVSPAGTNAQVVNATNTTGLVYAGYTSGTNYLTTASNSNQSDPYKAFNGSAIPTNDQSVFYISFVMQVDAARSNGGNGNYVLTLSTVNGSAGTAVNGTAATLYIRSTSVGATTFNVGVSTNTAVPGTWGTTSYNMNTTYLVVMKYVNGAASDDDNVYVWLNPASVSSEPAIASAAASDTGADNFVSGTDYFKYFQLYQQANAAGLSIDGIRVAYARTGSTGSTQTVNSAAAWTNLAPAGAPLPVKFGAIKATEKQKGIQLDWTSYDEVNMNDYTIERSSDGINFSVVGTVNALNSTASRNDYSFFDATPLAGVNIYRIRNNDIDGKSGYSNMVKVNLNKSVKEISLYPNPVRGGQVSIQASDLAKGLYQVRIINANGQIVYSQPLNHAGGAINQTIALTDNLKSGLYNLQLAIQGTTGIVKPFVLVK